MDDVILDLMIKKALVNDNADHSRIRTQAYYRDERSRHIARKKDIIRRVSPDAEHPYWVYKYEGELSKGKIHCSCPLCRFQGTSYGDMKSSAKMDCSMREYLCGENI